MTFVELENCKSCRFLPPLGQLPFLKTLWIKGLASVESVGAEFYGECSLPFPCLETLGFMDMPVWKKWLPCKGDVEIRVFLCLGELVICRCPKLRGCLPVNLDSLSGMCIEQCEELVVSIANYKYLHLLAIDGCKRVVHRSGVKFELLVAMGLYRIPEVRLEIDGFIRGLTKLQKLCITGCEELTCLWENEDRWLQRRVSNIIGGNISDSLSHFVQHLRSLQQLEIIGCSNLISFPEFGLPPSLKSLKIESCNFLTYFVRFQLPPSIRSIEIARCQNLRVLVKNAEKLEDYTTGQGGRLPRTLKTLYLTDCEQLESIVKTFQEDTSLDDLRIQKCANLKSLPEGLWHLSILHTLIIQECGSLVSFPRGELPSNLTHLAIFACDELEALPRGMDSLSSLQTLVLGFCGSLASILEEGLPPNLIKLSIVNPSCCKPLSEWGLHHLDRLKELWIGYCVDQDMKEVRLPKSFIQLHIEDFPYLKRLSPSFQSLTSLESLTIGDCPKLASIVPEQADHLPLSLAQLFIHDDCPLLIKRYQPGKGPHWGKIANIPYVYVGDADDKAEA